MFTYQMFVQAPTNIGAIHRGLLKSAMSGDFDYLTVAVAYATTKGTTALVDAFEKNIGQWADMEKEWFISIDNGITEPQALQALSELPNSRVWIPNAEKVLEANLRPKARFHMKSYLFGSQS